LSSNTNIGNTPVNQGYVQLIHTGETGGIDGTLRTLYDGDGTASDLQIASNKVKVSTELYIGSKTATEFIQDIVGDMFTTGSYTNITTTYDDTNGNIDLSASGEVTLTGSQTLTNKTLASPTFTGTANGANLTLSGDLTVNGTTTTLDTTNLKVTDNLIELNQGVSSNANDSGIIIERGSTGNNAIFMWDESADKFTLGTTTATADATGNITITTGTLVASTFEGNLTGNVTGSASLNLLISNNLSDLANAATARTNLGVDAAGTDNSTDVTLAGTLDYITLSGQQITRNAINLTTDVTGTLPVGNGGTGLTSISTLLNSNVTPTSLGLVIGTDVQAQDTLLQDIADFSLSNPSQDGYLIAYSDAEPQLELVAPGISFNGSTANGLLTYGNSTTADVESNLTFDGTTLNVNGDVKVGVGADGQLTSVNNGLAIRNLVSNADMYFYVNDGGVDTEAMRIDGATANVGIGTSSPTYELDVAGDIGVNHVIYHNDDTNTYHQFTNDRQRFFAGGELLLDLFEGTQDYVKLGDGGDVDINLNDDMFVEGSSGNVGIGTTSPVAKLDIQNSTAPTLDNDTHAGEAIFLRSGGSAGDGNVQAVLAFGKADGSSRRTGSAIASVQTDSDADRVGIGFYTSDSSASSQTMDQRMLLDHTGNVGIGTTSPNHALHVVGGIIANYTDSGGFYRYNASGGFRAAFHDNNSITRIFADGDGSNAAMTFNGGNVGIGTDSPDAKLEVSESGTGHGLGGIITETTTHNGNAGIRFRTNGTDRWAITCIGTNGSDLRIRDADGSADRIQIDSSGDLHCDQDVIAFSTTPSDKRLKKNIKDIDYGLDTIMKLNPKQYDWKEDDRHDIGFIAQEVEEVIPEIVKDKKHFDKEIKTLDYEKLTAVLIKAVQEQQQQINKLEDKLNG
jgi:hypothetical protein